MHSVHNSRKNLHVSGKCPIILPLYGRTAASPSTASAVGLFPSNKIMRGLIKRMSASQQKKRRQAQTPSAASNNDSGSNRGAWIAGGIGVAVLVILAIFFAVLNSGLLQSHTTAAVVGSHKLSPVMYNYFYQDVCDQNFVSYVTDTSKSLADQIKDTESGQTWADYLKEETNTVIAQTYAVYDAAVEAGYTLTEDDSAAIESSITTLTSYASSSSLSLNAYLAQRFGTGSDEDSFRQFAEVMQIANSYQTIYADSLTYTDDEIDAYYAEHKDDLDTYDYRVYNCSVTSDETDEDGNAVIDSAASEELAKEMAEASQGDEAAFAEQARQNASEDQQSTYEDDDATLTTNVTAANLSDTLKDWMTDPSRAYGDTTALENEDGSWQAVMFVSGPEKFDVNTRTVRHILIQANSSDDEAVASAEAEIRAQEILDEYLAGEQTEDAFAALAQAHSADSTAADGGLIENICPGDMVDAFEDWCFDASRQPGDTGIVESEYGFHVMYYVGEGGNAMDYRTESDMRVTDSNNWVTELGSALTVTNESFGMLFTQAD